ncbi:bromodomain-containing protein 4-like [Periophthalmus magnuspinnatus]|uniref:bromodomain-containing protein 4-like n=1 Tax=Periophthalmus magnuspinnatus TaxID=409849 RepID=UPI0024371F8E|nr:bromodomain-containing protein 4-like [Periophthalmus magnuspinnatus]
MACRNNRNSAVVFSLGLLLLSSLCQCINHTKKKFPENSISLSEIPHWHHGKLLIGLKTEQGGKSKEAEDADLDYQSDMTWEVPGRHAVQEHGFPRYDNTAVKRLLKMQPTVDCSGNYMRLKVQDADSKPGALLFVDRGDLSPLSLSKLPKSCGSKVSSTRRDLVMVAPYDGCFVIVEESCYVLPLLWFGLPVQMSCPMSQPLSPSSSNPPMVTCHAEGMVVKTDWTSGLSEIKVNLNGNWEPLMKASPRCGLGAVDHPEGITISISYKPCMKKKDGIYSMSFLKDDEVKVFCPSLASADHPKLMRHVRLVSKPAPTQNVKTTLQVPEYPLPPPPSLTWNQFYPYHLYMQQPQAVQPPVPQPTDDKMVGQPFYPAYPVHPQPEKQNPGSVPPGLDENLGHYYSLFYPNMPPLPEHPSQLDNHSLDVTQLQYQEWDLSEPHPAHPFYYPQDPVKRTATPEPAVLPEPEDPVPPVYLYPFYYPTEQPQATATASPPANLPQQYQLFGPYYYPLPSQHTPHITTIPTPLPTQNPQYPPISHPGKVVIFPQNAKPETRLPLDCPQYCQLGLPYCCPQVAFHHHMYHFVPHEQNGNYNPQFLPSPGFPKELRPNFVYTSSQGPQEAPVPPPAFTNPLVSPQLYPLKGLYEGHAYNQPLEGNPSAHSENKPSDQTHSQPASHHFEPNAHFLYRDHDTLWNHQDHNPEPPNGAPLHYSEYFDPVQRTNMHLPYNMQSSQQSDGPNVNPRPLLSRIRQYVHQPVNNADGNGPESLVFRSQQDPQLVPYHTLQEQDNFSKKRPTEALRRTTKREGTESFVSEPKGYVLLQQGPPGRESGSTVQPSPYNPVVLGQNLKNNFPNRFLNLKEESEGLKVENENSGNAVSTLGDMSGSLPQTTSAGHNSAPTVRVKPTIKSVRFPQRLFSPFGYRHRTSQHNVPQ